MDLALWKPGRVSIFPRFSTRRSFMGKGAAPGPRFPTRSAPEASSCEGAPTINILTVWRAVVAIEELWKSYCDKYAVKNDNATIVVDFDTRINVIEYIIYWSDFVTDFVTGFIIDIADITINTAVLYEHYTTV